MNTTVYLDSTRTISLGGRDLDLLRHLSLLQDNRIKSNAVKELRWLADLLIRLHVRDQVVPEALEIFDNDDIFPILCLAQKLEDS